MGRISKKWVKLVPDARPVVNHEAKKWKGAKAP